MRGIILNPRTAVPVLLTIQGHENGAPQPSPSTDLAHDAGALGARGLSLRIDSYLDDSEEVLKSGPGALLRPAPPPGPSLRDRVTRPLTGGHEVERGHLFLTQWRLVFARNDLALHYPPIFAPLPDVTEVAVEQVGLGRVLTVTLRNGRQHRFACRGPGAWATALAALTGLE